MPIDKQLSLRKWSSNRRKETVKGMVGYKLNERIVKKRATKAIKIKNENDNKLL